MSIVESEFIVCCQCSGVNKLPKDKLQKKAKCGKCKTPLFSGKVFNLHQHNFSRYINKNSLPIVVDFWASWCGPCKMMAPVFEKVSMEMHNKAFFFKVNTEQEQLLSSQFAIKSIPTLILFKQGKEINRQAGALDENSLTQWVEHYA